MLTLQAKDLIFTPPLICLKGFNIQENKCDHQILDDGIPCPAETSSLCTISNRKCSLIFTFFSLQPGPVSDPSSLPFLMLTGKHAEFCIALLV